ncbi:MAG: DUF6262 family protein [Actinomycetota bacterium]|nr:DUF6262 family protein [Actinomycetota bacterium]
MPPDNSAHLAAAARRRSQQTSDQTRKAIRRLDRQGQAINIQAVAHAAGVSRSFIYRHQELRDEIDRLRPERRVNVADRLPAALRATEDSNQARNETLRAEIVRLTEENRWLRQQAETLLGERRAAPRQGPGET